MSVHPVKAAANVRPYELFMLALCVWALLMLGADTLLALADSTKTILQYADNAICALFFADFVYNIRRRNRARYFVTWGWSDLLSSIPMVDAFRLGRAARIVRIVRVLRAMRSAREIAHYVMTKRAESAALTAVLVALLLLVFSSIAILQFELPSGGNIQSAEDASWWAISPQATAASGRHSLDVSLMARALAPAAYWRDRVADRRSRPSSVP